MLAVHTSSLDNPSLGADIVFLVFSAADSLSVFLHHGPLKMHKYIYPFFESVFQGPVLHKIRLTHDKFVTHAVIM